MRKNSHSCQFNNTLHNSPNFTSFLLKVLWLLNQPKNSIRFSIRRCTDGWEILFRERVREKEGGGEGEGRQRGKTKERKRESVTVVCFFLETSVIFFLSFRRADQICASVATRICFRQSAVQRMVSRDRWKNFICISIVAVRMRRIFAFTNGIGSAEFVDTAAICSLPPRSLSPLPFLPAPLASISSAMMLLFPYIAYRGQFVITSNEEKSRANRILHRVCRFA